MLLSLLNNLATLPNILPHVLFLDADNACPRHNKVDSFWPDWQLNHKKTDGKEILTPSMKKIVCSISKIKFDAKNWFARLLT